MKEIIKNAYEVFGFTPQSWAIAKRAMFKCEYCGKDLLTDVYVYELFQIDHIYPKSKGGSELDANYALSCKLCNRLKRDEVFDVDYTNRSESINIIGQIMKKKISEKCEILNLIREVYVCNK